MDRLYREIRLGIITPEMGTVLFGVLTRVLDSGLCDAANSPAGSPGRAKADKLRPKVADLLTRAEHAAWRKAVANAPREMNERKTPDKTQFSGQKPRTAPAKPRKAAPLQLAS